MGIVCVTSVLVLTVCVCAGDISIGIKCAPGVVGPAEADIDFDIIRNDNDTFTVKYTPPGAGSYTIMVLFADQVGAVCVCVCADSACVPDRVCVCVLTLCLCSRLSP